jgi:hypothetical protein
MVAGRRRWIERMKAAGRKLPSGRKAGAAWVTPRMKERQRAEAERLEAQRRAKLTPAERYAEDHSKLMKAAIERIDTQLAILG